MIVDTSAIICVMLKEPGFEGPFDKLASADALGVGAPTLTETGHRSVR